MSTIPANTSSSSPSADDRNLVPVDETYIAPSFEDRLAIFWAKNSKTVIAVFVVVVLAVIAKGGYDFFAAQREKSIVADYAAAATTTQLKGFIAGHAGHPLAGIAQLRLADEAYVAGNYADAQSGYAAAAATLANTTFGQRARLGSATALVQVGKTAEAEAALTLLVSDLSLGKGIRAAAAYQLAALAVEAGKTDAATGFITQVAAIDPAGQWAQRATLLRARFPSPVIKNPVINLKPTP